MKINLGRIPLPQGNLKISMGQSPHHQNYPQDSQEEKENTDTKQESRVQRLTKIISTKVIPKTQNYPEYSRNSIPSTEWDTRPIKSGPIRVVSKTIIQRRLFGVPIASLFLLLLVFGTAIAAGVYFKQIQGTIQVASMDYSSFEPVDFTENNGLNMTGGSSVTRTFRVTNTGADFAMNALVNFTIDGVTQGECKIWLRDNAGAQLSADDTVSGSELSTVATYGSIGQGTYKDGKFEVQCTPDVNKTFGYTLTMEPQATFNFKSS